MPNNNWGNDNWNCGNGMGNGMGNNGMGMGMGMGNGMGGDNRFWNNR